MSNPFFTNYGPFNISEILNILRIDFKTDGNQIVIDVKDLFNAKKIVLHFFTQKNTLNLQEKQKHLIVLQQKN